MEFNLNRRAFIKAMGGAGLATILSCDSQPIKRIVSHVTPQQELVPGVVTWFASVCRECQAGCGTVTATMGAKPIKIEGNPLHPINNGALCARGQAALQGLYNPDRVSGPARKGPEGRFESVEWDSVLQHLGEIFSGLKNGGSLERVAVVTPHLSGSLSTLLDTWIEENPGVEVYEYEPVSYESIEKANAICFDRGVLPLYNLREADLIVSFGADFLETWLSPVKYTSDFAVMRAYHDGNFGRLLYIGSRQSLTAANADETVMIKPGSYGALVLGMIRVMLEEGLISAPTGIDHDTLRDYTNEYDPQTVLRMTGISEDRTRYLARVLAGSRRSIVLPGNQGLAGTNATRNIISVNLLNYLLGNYGKTINIPENDPHPRRNTTEDFSRLIEKMGRGEIRLILFYGVNPAYSLPPSSGFLEAVQNVETVISCSDAYTETTEISEYVLPMHTPLESWGDYVPVDGIYGLMQPMVRPVGDSKHFGDVLLELSRLTVEGSLNLSEHEDFYNYLVSSWKNLARTFEPGESFDDFWESALRRGGYFREPAVSPVRLSEKVFDIGYNGPEIEPAGRIDTDNGRKGSFMREATLIVYPSMIHYDGRGANKPWLQELQDPVLQTVWGNYIEISNEIAEGLGLENGDVLKITSPHGTLESPLYVSRHSYGGSVSIAMGQGHRAYGRFANGTGVNPVELLPFSFDEISGQAAYLSVSVGLEPTGRKVRIPSPEGNPYDEDRGIAQTISLTSLRNLTKEQQESPHNEHEFKELLTPHDHPKYRWGMVIDLNLCVGCGACVTACFAENNISVVGEELYLQGREMTWIRVERYFDKEHPDKVRFIPIPCQHCDNAPCEPVCPVHATYHTPEGLNAQIYNRCVGTRYCANNCPYNVRRFNWFTYKFAKPLNLQLNPNVTVRTKGVMEKCSFCVQRIVMAKDKARNEDRELRNGEITPACAQTCPTKAITFGDLKDADAEVSIKARNTRGYRVLDHLNTKPAITYLKKIVGGIDLG